MLITCIDWKVILRDAAVPCGQGCPRSAVNPPTTKWWSLCVLQVHPPLWNEITILLFSSVDTKGVTFSWTILINSRIKTGIITDSVFSQKHLPQFSWQDDLGQWKTGEKGKWESLNWQAPALSLFVLLNQSDLFMLSYNTTLLFSFLTDLIFCIFECMVFHWMCDLKVSYYVKFTLPMFSNSRMCL